MPGLGAPDGVSRRPHLGWLVGPLVGCEASPRRISHHSTPNGVPPCAARPPPFTSVTAATALWVPGLANAGRGHPSQHPEQAHRPPVEDRVPPAATRASLASWR